jgi:Zn finger protein HypA/HybF involved in hydrogenase expression
VVTITSLIAPIITLAIAILIGVAFNFVPVKSQARKPIPLVVFAMVVGVLGFIFTAMFSSIIYSIGLFQSFAAIFEDVGISIIKYNAQLVAIIVLIAALETGLASGFGGAFAIDNMKLKRKEAKLTTGSATAKIDESPRVSTQTNPTVVTTNLLANSPDTAEKQGLRRDEQSIIELFLYGKVNQITPTVNPTKPEGYTYEGIPQLDWDTKHTRQVLDSLVRKGYLNAELTDKVIVCQTCGSGNVRIIKTCPECGSLRLQKEGLIEHFSCGAVERQSAYETKNGDLLCPKCKVKLQLIGSDYRMLPPAYKCLGCNTLNSEPKLTVKCGDCTSTADIDDEPEILLYKYTANVQMPAQELLNIKPLDKVTDFFKSSGYTIVAPAYVSGKSGTQHLFDMLILGRVGWVETQKTAGNAIPRNDNGNTAVEVIVSSKPVSLAEITRIFGKISDVDCDFLLFAIPGLTANARNYAKAYGVKVSEGKDIEEALANSKIPKVSEVKA